MERSLRISSHHEKQPFVRLNRQMCTAGQHTDICLWTEMALFSTRCLNYSRQIIAFDIDTSYRISVTLSFNPCPIKFYRSQMPFPFIHSPLPCHALVPFSSQQSHPRASELVFSSLHSEDRSLLSPTSQPYDSSKTQN